jgi:sulfite reductase (NADPH) hemoprotein beta-component
VPSQLKIAIAVPPTNDVDVFVHDIGFIAIVDEHGKLAGFNVSAGGGQGVTYGNKKTYPSTGNMLGFVTPEQGFIVGEKILVMQRDHGNRLE